MAYRTDSGTNLAVSFTVLPYGRDLMNNLELTQCKSHVWFTRKLQKLSGFERKVHSNDFLSLGGTKQDLEFLARLCVSEGAKIYWFGENSTGRGA